MASNGHHHSTRPSSRSSKTPTHTNPLLADAARLLQQRQQAAQATPSDDDPLSPPDHPNNKRKHSPIPWPEPSAKAARTVAFASTPPQHSEGTSPSGTAPSRSGFSSRWADELEAPEPTVQQQGSSPGPPPGPALPGPDDGLDPELVYGEEVDQGGSSDGEAVEEAGEEEEPEEPPIPVRGEMWQYGGCLWGIIGWYGVVA